MPRIDVDAGHFSIQQDTDSKKRIVFDNLRDITN
jgi:hypothetical protein